MENNLRNYLKYELSNAQKKKLKILEQALIIISKFGIKKLTISEISRKTKISKALIIYHYKDINAIYRDLFYILGKQGQDFTEQALASKKTSEEKLAGIIEGAFTWLLNYPMSGNLFLLMYQEATVSEEFYKIHKTILDTGLKRIKVTLEENKTLNKKPHKKNIASIALGIHNLMIGSLIRMVTLKDQKNYKSYIANLKENIELLTQLNLPEIDIKK